MRTNEEKALKRQSKEERFQRRLEMDDLREILKLPAGRRFIWRLIGHGGLFSSIWVPSAEIHRKAGMRDFSQFIWCEVEEANQEAIFDMLREAKARRDGAAIEEEKEDSKGEDS